MPTTVSARVSRLVLATAAAAIVLGAAAFLFFLIKGLLWLIVPGALAYWAMNK